MTITPVILCGGSGTRLWPLSRKSYPKQFSRLLGETTLFQQSAQRVGGEGFEKPVILTNSDFRFIVTEQLQEVGIDPKAVLIEPEPRNTAPAILAAALFLAKNDPKALMLVLPSDHVVPDHQTFTKTVQAGVEAALDGDLVTFGITPHGAETGYGYLELSGKPNGLTPIKLNRFVEKPDKKSAEMMLDEGSYLWNAGIFLFRAQDFVEAVEAHCSQLIAPVSKAMAAVKPDLDFLRIDPDWWGKAESISVDYAIMEHAVNLSAVPYGGDWSDLGDWNSVWREMDQAENGVVAYGASVALDCRDTLLRSESEKQVLVGIGLENIVVVAMPDAVLVADKSRTQEVKKAVTYLKEKPATQAAQFPKDHRPWGSFESLHLDERFQVKRIVVKPGGILSLKSHNHRSEHWIIVEGTARVTIGNDVKLVRENQSVYVPLGKKHRLENPGKVPMVLIEVQTGSYLGEDDIERYEDIYARD